MANIVQVIFISITLVLSVFIWVYALFRSFNNKKEYFLLMQAMVIIYLLGYLLELSSSNVDEAYTGVRLLYVGSYFTAVFAFFFIADYCNLRIHNLFIKTPMVLLAAGIVLTMWTTKYHGLIYQEYSFSTEFINRLTYTPGSLYALVHYYPSACMILSMVILFNQFRKWSKKYRKHLIILVLCMAIPFIAEGIYFLKILINPGSHPLYITPFSIALMSFCLYLGVLRFNIFGIISTATITAMEHIREGFVLIDDEGNYLSSNPAAAKIFPEISGYKKGNPIYSLPGWPQELVNIESDIIEFPMHKEKTRYFRASASPVQEKNNTIAVIFLFREITDNINLMKELENAAYIDSLTGIYNRKHFSELAAVDINRALRQNQTIYTAMLDLDFFKNVNDTHGHAAGDLVLKKTAEIIHNTIRSYDLAGRYGGEEFVLLFLDLGMREAENLMERIRENMENSVTLYESIEINITCSIGLALFTKDDTLESAIKKADEALYMAKNSGRNQVKVYPDNR